MSLTPAQARGLFVPITVLVMSGVMSLVMTALNLGLAPDFFVRWLRNWSLGYLVAFPTALLVVPRVQGWLARHTVTRPLETPSATQREVAS